MFLQRKRSPSENVFNFFSISKMPKCELGITAIEAIKKAQQPKPLDYFAPSSVGIYLHIRVDTGNGLRWEPY